MALSLERYGLIGDCQTAALVGVDGYSHVGLINTARNLTDAGGPAEERRTA